MKNLARVLARMQGSEQVADLLAQMSKRASNEADALLAQAQQTKVLKREYTMWRDLSSEAAWLSNRVIRARDRMVVR